MLLLDVLIILVSYRIEMNDRSDDRRNIGVDKPFESVSLYVVTLTMER